MANLTPAQRAAADAMINGTFANPAMQTQGWGEAPVQNTSMEDALIRQGIRPGIPMSAQINATPSVRYASPAQRAQISAVPANSYQTPRGLPIVAPNIPYGSQYPDTGNKGRASGAMTQQLGINYPVPPPPAPPAPPPRPPVADWGQISRALAQASMSAPQGANPGIGGALLGNGQMSSQIPAQLPPADGSSPLPVWAGATPTAPGGPQQAAQQRQQQATGQAGGYQYQNGQKVAYAPVNFAGQPFTATSGASAYTLANNAGRVNALVNQANQTGQTGVYNYSNGVRGTTVNGGSGASAYDQANAAAAARARANASNPSSQSSNSWFSSVTGG